MQWHIDIATYRYTDIRRYRHIGKTQDTQGERDAEMATWRSYRVVTYVRADGWVTCAGEFELPFETDLKAIAQGAMAAWNRQRRRKGGIGSLDRIEVWREGQAPGHGHTQTWVQVGTRDCWTHWCDVGSDGSVTFRDMRARAEATPGPRPLWKVPDENAVGLLARWYGVDSDELIGRLGLSRSLSDSTDRLNDDFWSHAEELASDMADEAHRGVPFDIDRAAAGDFPCRDGHPIRAWYQEAFPKDDLGREIDGEASFEGLAEVLNGPNGDDFYEYVGVGDSVVRERCFERLAEMRGIEYEDVYDAWLHADTPLAGFFRWEPPDKANEVIGPEEAVRILALSYERGAEAAQEPLASQATRVSCDDGAQGRQMWPDIEPR